MLTLELVFLVARIPHEESLLQQSFGDKCASPAPAKRPRSGRRDASGATLLIFGSHLSGRYLEYKAATPMLWPWAGAAGDKIGPSAAVRSREGSYAEGTSGLRRRSCSCL